MLVHILYVRICFWGVKRKINHRLLTFKGISELKVWQIEYNTQSGLFRIFILYWPTKILYYKWGVFISILSHHSTTLYRFCRIRRRR